MTEIDIIPPSKDNEHPLAHHAPAGAAVIPHRRRRRVADLEEDDPRRLTPREARFVNRYLEHGNELRAMKEAGYEVTSRALARALLGKTSVYLAVDEQVAAVADMYRVSNARIIAEHARIAFGSVADLEEVLKAESDEAAVEAFNALPPEVRAAVRKFKVRTRYDKEGNRTVEVDIDMHDKQRSLDALAKVTKLYDGATEDEEMTSFAMALRRATLKLQEMGSQ